MSVSPVYLDHAATTPADPRVIDAMLPYFGEEFGNPSSVHRWGQRAEAAVERARQSLADGLNCLPDEIVFTSCGSESDNLAVHGAALAARERTGANHVLVSPVEHPAVLRTAAALADHYGFEVERIPVDQFGRVDPEDVAARLTTGTALVTVMTANNEIGSLNPIAEIGEVCRQHGVVFHTDAVQAGAHMALDTHDLKVDLLSLGAHKFYGPKGVGALFIRRGTRVIPTQSGGSHERGLRAGTHNVPLIVGMAEAFRLAIEERALHNAQAITLRDRLLAQIPTLVVDSQVTGHPSQRLPNHASFVFRDLDGNRLLAALDLAGFACSSGSACKTGDPEPSEVLIALGLGPEWALGSLRVTVGRATTPAQIDALLEALPAVVERLRQAEAMSA